MLLVPCSGCRRHIAADEDDCPFCRTRRSGSPTLFVRAGRISRAAIFASTAACWTSSSPQTTSQFATPPPEKQEAQSEPEVPEDMQNDAGMPDPSLAPKPRADRGTIFGRVTNSKYRRMPGVTITVVGSTSHRVVTDAKGYFIVENLVPGIYRVTIPTARMTPQDPPNSADIDVIAGQVSPIGMLGEIVPRPIERDNACCKPYGAPPARRRVV